MEPHPDDQGRIRDAPLEHVDAAAVAGIHATVDVVSVDEPAYHVRPGEPGVLDDLPQRGSQCTAHGLDTELLLSAVRL